MTVLRAVWWVMALAAVVFALWSAMSPISGVSLLCSKTGELGLDGEQASFQCDDPIVQVLGVWPPVELALLLAVPPLVAAIAMRCWVSWLVVATFFGLTLVGIANWSGFWMSLWFAVPLALIALVVATAQQVVTHEGRSGPVLVQ